MSAPFAAATATVNRRRRHVHLDCFSGAAGDMLLAGCLDASDDAPALLQHVTRTLKMGLPEIANEFDVVSLQKVWRGGMGSIAGLHVQVQSIYEHRPAPVPNAAAKSNTTTTLEIQEQEPHGHSHNHSHSHSHGHSHDHSHHTTPEEQDPHPQQQEEETAHHHDHSHNHHSHDHHHSHNNNHHHHSNNGPLRNLPQILQLLQDASTLSDWVKDMAATAFTELARAEMHTHGASHIDEVHFHEVGAVDSIVDTIATLVAMEALGVRTVTCSRLPVGEGTVWTQHGCLPVPAPATLRLMQDLPICPGPPGVTGELVTPTGAALIRALCKNADGLEIPVVGRPPLGFTIRSIGIGAGTKDFEKHPNILRVLLGNLEGNGESNSPEEEEGGES